MPLLIALALIAAAFLFALVMIPFALLFRYRLGTRRQRARVWVATINGGSLAISAVIFLVSAGFASRIVPDSFSFAAGGLALGGVVGLLGLVLTRWERDESALFFTPSRLLVLGVTLVVVLRIAYGFWRAWHTMMSTPDGESWIGAIGIPGSLAAGAVIIGYYLVYWTGVRSRALRAREIRWR